MTVLMRAMTELGSPLVIAGLTLVGGLVLYRRGQRIAPIAVVVSLLGSWLWDLMLKRQYGRPRPPGPWLVHATGYSFPSGHAVVAVAFYGVLAYYLIRRPLHGDRGLAAVLFSVLVVMLIGISRIYLGVHYPSDVIAGWAIGGVWASLCIMGAAAVRDRVES
jgi:undecaprenyl-diphosphatase